MSRLPMMLSVLVLLMAAAARPVSVKGQDADLASYLPDRDNLPADMVVVDQGTRTLDEVANTFADPATATQHLESWGWQENVVLELAPKDPSSSQLTQVQISLHRFATEEGAADAMAYFVTERAADLGIQEVLWTSAGDKFRGIEGAVGGEFESTVYARAGAIVIRVTARESDATRQPGSPYSSASHQASNILDAIYGFGHYISPQFGYEIEWYNRVWPHAESTSIPGVWDELLLSSDDATLLYRGEVAPSNATPSPDAVPLPGGRGMVTRTLSLVPMPNPLPPGIVSEDWAAAADNLPPQAPPFGLDALALEGLTTDRIGQAAPQAAGRLALTHVGEMGPPGHYNVSVLRGGPSIFYTDPGDASVRATLLVDDVTPGVTANEAIRYIYNLGFFAGGFAERGIHGADVRRDAPIPYFLTDNQLVFGTRDGNWVVTVNAPTLEDLEALVRALIAGLD